MNLTQAEDEKAGISVPPIQTGSNAKLPYSGTYDLRYCI